MSEIAEIVNTLEIRIRKLVSKLENLEHESEKLTQDIEKSARIIENQSREIELLQSKYNSLKIASSLLGSDDNKKDTKLKINSLIREIDYCIAQLSN